ncbi:hypothetical protein KEJ14_03730 [Candidatus Bathyarchaeota archaeon]|nr:hypothetical protein [Candidatus Bathyarchaeota archaeon]
MGNSFEEALSNINVFCSVLVRKIIEGEETQIKPELIENMLRRKYTVEIYRDYGEEESLVDVFEDEKKVKILVRCSCKEREIEFHPHKYYTEIWIGKNQKIRLPIDPPDMNKTTVRCNNQILEITIRK